MLYVFYVFLMLVGCVTAVQAVDPVVKVDASWDGDDAWYRACSVTVENLGPQDLDYVKLGFSHEYQPVQDTGTGGFLLKEERNDKPSDWVCYFSDTLLPLKAGGAKSVKLGFNFSDGTGMSASLPADFTVNGFDPATGEGDDEPPTVPQVLVSENVKPRSFVLRWDASTDNVGVVGYNVTYYPYDDMASSSTMGTVSTSTKISGLLSDKTYGCTVLAFDAAGNKSAASETLFVTTTSGSEPADRRAAPYVNAVGSKEISAMEMVDKAGLTSLIAGFVEAREDKACWAGHGVIYNPNTDINEEGDAVESDYLRQFLSTYPDSAISVGGPYGLPPAANASMNANKLTDIYKGILDNYGVKTLDFHYAGGFLADTEALGRHVEAVVRLMGDRPDTQLIYTLPVKASADVQGFTRYGEIFLKLLSDNGVVPTVVQCFLKDFGEGSGDNLYDASVVALEAAHGQIKEVFSDEWSDDEIWTHMGACPMFGKHDNDKVFTLANQTSLNTFCQGKGMSLMSGWSIDRDANDKVGIEDYQPYDFSKEVAKFAVAAP